MTESWRVKLLLNYLATTFQPILFISDAIADSKATNNSRLRAGESRKRVTARSPTIRLSCMLNEVINCDRLFCGVLASRLKPVVTIVAFIGLIEPRGRNFTMLIKYSMSYQLWNRLAERSTQFSHTVIMQIIKSLQYFKGVIIIIYLLSWRCHAV